MLDCHVIMKNEEQKLTLHYTSMVGRKSKTILGDLHVDLVRKANGLEELV